MRGNPDNLRQAAARKSAAAQSRAEQALRDMLRQQQPITFRGLAHAAGVSLDFLYHHTDLRPRIEQLRAQQSRPNPPPPATTDQPSNVVRALTAQINELKRRHRDETNALREALQAAHGENLHLRRQLGHRHDHQPAQPPPTTDSLPDATASVLPA
jgi:hypothetical protein